MNTTKWEILTTNGFGDEITPIEEFFVDTVNQTFHSAQITPLPGIGGGRTLLSTELLYSNESFEYEANYISSTPWHSFRTEAYCSDGWVNNVEGPTWGFFGCCNPEIIWGDFLGLYKYNITVGIDNFTLKVKKPDNTVVEKIYTDLAPPCRFGFMTTAVNDGTIHVDYDNVIVTKNVDPALGIINVNSNPTAADFFVDDIFQGVTPISVNVEPGNHSLTFAKFGYYNYSVDIFINSGESIYLNVILFSINGSVFATSTPSESNFYIDNILSGVTPVTVNDIIIGNHSVSFRKIGYYNYNTTIFVTVNQTTFINANLTPFNGTLNVFSNPSQANVLIDDVFYGVTPFTISLIPGPYTLKVTKTGYYDFISPVLIMPLNQTNVTANLSPLNGSVYATSEPSGANFFINGTFVGLTPINVSYYPGYYPVNFSKSGYFNFNTNISVNTNEITFIHAILDITQEEDLRLLKERVSQLEIELNNTKQRVDILETVVDSLSISFNNFVNLIRGYLGGLPPRFHPQMICNYMDERNLTQYSDFGLTCNLQFNGSCSCFAPGGEI